MFFLRASAKKEDVSRVSDAIFQETNKFRAKVQETMVFPQKAGKIIRAK